MAFEGTLQEITVRMHGNETRDTRIEVQQGDTASRKVRIRLKTFGGADYIVPYGARAVLCISKNDGKKVYDECDIEDKNVVLVTLSDQAISCSGLQKAQIYIFSEEGDIKTQVFQVNVPKAVYSDDAIESSDEFGILHELIVENSAIQQAEQMRIEAEAIRTASEEERQANAATMVTATEACLAVIEDARAVAYARGNAIVQTASGEIIVIDDSSDDQLRGLRVFGKTEQFTTTGAQLFELKSDYVDKTRGLQVNVNEDGSLTVNGIPNTFYASCYNGHVYLEPGTYFVSGGENKAGCVYAQITKLYADGTSKYISNEAFVVDGTESAIRFNIQAGLALDEVNNYTIYPMLNAGDTALPYEPYTGGIPSPNPQYPQEIVSVGDAGDVEVWKHGGNLLDYTEWSKVKCLPSSGILEWKDNGVAITSVTKDTYTAHAEGQGGIYKIPCKPKDVYTLSWEWIGSSGTVFVFFNGISNNNVRVDASEGSLTFTIPEDTTFFTFRVGCYTAGTTCTYKNVRINLGDTVLPFEPYHKQSLTIPTPNGLPGIKVTDASLATYTDENGQMWCSDEVDLERGVYVQRVDKVHLTSDMTWRINVSGHKVYTSFGNNRYSIAGNSPIACTHATLGNWIIISRGTCSLGNGIEAVCGFDVNDFPTVSDLTEWLDKETVYIVVPLLTPIETPLSETELAAYRALYTNCPNTTVMNDENAHMEVMYNVDTKLYIDNKFAELKTALVALGGN